jgi:hypothetical protein
MGLEADGDSIRSNNLGLHARNRGAGYVDLDLRPAKKRWSLSVGAREEIFSGGAQAVFSPELAGSFRVANSLEAARERRIWIQDSDVHRSLLLRSVDARECQPQAGVGVVGDGGADWTPSAKVTLSATGFYSQQHDTIDYVKSATPNPYLPAGCPANIWCADNLNGLVLPASRRASRGFQRNRRRCGSRGRVCTGRRARCMGLSRSMFSIIRSRTFMRRGPGRWDTTLF